MRLGIAIFISAALAGCAKNDSQEAPAPAHDHGATTQAADTAAAVAPPTSAPSSSAPAAAGEVLEVHLTSVGNTMAFDITQITAKTGQKVHLTLKNGGTLKLMPHNWVLVKPGTEASVAAQGMKEAPDAGYVVPGPDVLAFTPLAGPGETVEVTFTAPAPGTYPFVCTVIGHYVLMKGKMTVTPLRVE